MGKALICFWSLAALYDGLNDVKFAIFLSSCIYLVGEIQDFMMD